MNKQHRILTALLVIQLVLVAVFWTTRTGTPGVKATKPLLEMDREKVVALEIEQSPESEAPKKLTLDLKEGHWRLSSHFDYPADEAKVSDFIDKLLAVRVRDPLSQSLKAAAQLKTSDDHYERRVTLKTASGQETLYFGAGQKAGALVRLKDHDETYVATSINLWALNPNLQNFIETRLVPLDAIKEITLQNAFGQIAMTQDEKTEWHVEGLDGQKIDDDLVRSFVSTARYLTVTAPAGKGEKPEQNLGQAKLLLSNGKETAKVLLGGKADEEGESYYAKVEGKEDVVTVPKYAAEKLLNQKLEEFVEKPAPKEEAVPTLDNNALFNLPAIPE